MRNIQLTRGKVALVDDEDFESVQKHRWYAAEVKKKNRPSGWYARSKIGGQILLMHNLVMQTSPVDHINHDGLDNRRGNLRPATISQNGANARHVIGVSGFRGVSRDGSRWRARVKFEGKHYCLGTFVDPLDAARAYDRAATSFWGQYAMPNLPQELEDSAKCVNTEIRMEVKRRDEVADESVEQKCEHLGTTTANGINEAGKTRRAPEGSWRQAG